MSEMNILFTTQGKTLMLFYNLLQELRAKTEIDKVGFYMADSRYYDIFEKQHPEISSGKYELLKEWEIIEQSEQITPDIDRLRAYERMFGDPVLWNAILADRRIYFGKRMTLEQDYPSRFSHDKMLAILQKGVEEIEKLFDRVQPDVVIGFICVTIGEYLAYLVARSRNIPYLNLRPTRIKNYFFASERLFEPSKKIEGTYHQMLTEGVPENLRQEALLHLSEVRKTHAMYEGVVLPPAKNATSGSGIKFVRELGYPVLSLGRLMKEFYNYNYGKYRHDSHYWGSFYKTWFEKIKKPARIRYIDYSLGRRYIDESKLSMLDFVFYPMHKEPEVSLLVFGRPYLNQIEVVRNIARSLPVGMKLVVKEHPGAVGYRPLSYYKKLISIPNVLIVYPGMESRKLVQSAKMVAVISGSVGLEALMMKKPVIYFGNLPFCILPDSMIRHVKDPDNLAWGITDLIKNHKHDEQALIAYISAVIKSSVQVDFYSVLLARKGVYNPDLDSVDIETEYTEQMERLSAYILDQVKTGQDRLSTAKTGNT